MKKWNGIVFSILISAALIAGGNFIFKENYDCANSLSCKSDLSLQVDNNSSAIFEGRKITPPEVDLNIAETSQNVLGESTGPGEKHIYVDLSRQTLFAYQGQNEVMEALVSSGKWKRTPAGNFKIWEKLRSTRMTGGEGEDFYDLPNVPYVMYFHNDFGLHGAYWHNNFGHPMSHGCVNMRPVDAQALFSWADVGTPVSVCNSFTKPGTCVQNDPIN